MSHFNHIVDEKQDEHIKLFNTVRKLKNCNRLSGFPIIKKYSVAEHCYYTAILFQQLGDKLDVVITDTCLFTVLCHDVLEAITGDVLRPAKEFSSAVHESWNFIEERIVDSPKYGYLTMFNNATIKNALTNEQHLLLKICDILELYRFILEEGKLGNKSTELNNILNNCISYLESITPKEWYKEICKYL